MPVRVGMVAVVRDEERFVPPVRGTKDGAQVEKRHAFLCDNPPEALGVNTIMIRSVQHQWKGERYDEGSEPLHLAELMQSPYPHSDLTPAVNDLRALAPFQDVRAQSGIILGLAPHGLDRLKSPIKEAGPFHEVMDGIRRGRFADARHHPGFPIARGKEPALRRDPDCDFSLTSFQHVVRMTQSGRYLIPSCSK